MDRGLITNLLPITFLVGRTQCLGLWKKVGDFTSQRKCHASVIWGNYIITFGGCNGNQDLNDIIVFDLRHHKWQTIQPRNSIPVARAGHSMCLTANSSILVFGGCNGRTHIMAEIGLMTPRLTGEEMSIEWEVIRSRSQNPPSRSYHTVHMYKNLMYVFGGLNENNRECNQLLSFNLDTLTWDECRTSGDLPGKCPRHFHSSTLFDHKLYVLGGGFEYFRDFYMLDMQKMTWTKILSAGTFPNTVFATTLVELDKELYVFGGADSLRVSDEIVRYSITHNYWKKIDNITRSPSSRYFHTSVCVNKNIFIIGGSNRFQTYFSDINLLTIEQKTIQETLMPQIEPSILKDSFLEKDFADVIFKVENQDFPAHKIILSQRCKNNILINKQLQGSMFESNIKEIPFPGLKASTFKGFLSILGFIYGHEIKGVEEDLALELLELSDKYLLPDLKEEAERVLARFLEVENIVKIAIVAESFGGSILKEAVLKFLTNNHQIIKDLDDLDNIPKSFLVQMIRQLTPR